MSAAPRIAARSRAHAIAPRAGGRPWTFYVLATVFILYVLALYGPMICIYILSFQDVRGGLVFPMKGLSLHWFVDLFTQVRTGDVKGSFEPLGQARDHRHHHHRGGLVPRRASRSAGASTATASCSI